MAFSLTCPTEPSGRREGRRWSDVAAVAVAAIMVTLWFIDPEPTPAYNSSSYLAASIVLGILGTTVLWWRRSLATLVATALIVLSVFFGVVAGPSLVALFTVAGYRPLRHVLAVTLLALATVPLQISIGTPLPRDVIPIGTVLLCAFILLAVGWALALKSRRELVDSLRERAAQLVRERDLVDEQVRRAEREAVASELHDSLAHQLTLISMSAGTLRYRRDEIPDELAGLVETLQHQSTTALDSLRSSLRDLRTLRTFEDSDTLHAGEDLGAAILDLVEEVRSAGQKVELSVHADRGLSVRLSSIIFRAVRELLTNARKHAPGAPVSLTVRANRESGILVECSNSLAGTGSLSQGNGGNHAEQEGQGTGLSGIAERIQGYGGTLKTGRTTESVFSVQLRAPWSV